MKTNRFLLLILTAFLGLAIVRDVFGANVAIKDIATTSVLPATNDFTVTDGATYGTRKVAMKGLTFLTTTRVTLAALSITGAADGTGVLVLGATAAGDGGGSSYFWSAASAATPNGDTVIQPASLPATGRWLKAVGSVGFPGVSTLGGVLSNAGLAHKFVSSINTDGTVTLTQPAASDITGLGSMAFQNSSGVAITGGTIEALSSLGNVTPIVNAGITNLNVGSGLHILTGAGLVLDPGAGFSRNANSGVGSYISFNQTSVGSWQIGSKPTTGEFTFNGIVSDSFKINYTTGAATFTTLAASSNTNLRTTKGSLHLTINVKDFGAIGDGSADDTAAINSAIAALTNYSQLFFPAGTYKITGSLTGLTGLNNVRIFGENARIFSNVTGAAGNTFVADATCSFIDFDHLSIVGSATVRGSGIHIRLYSSYSSVTNCYLQGCSDFAIHCNNVYCRIENNTIVAPLGDGIHFGEAKNFVCVGNNISGTGDDGIGIVADTAGLNPERGVVVGNNIFNSASAGIRIDEANDMLVANNSIQTTVGAGIEVNRYLSTTFYSGRIHIKSNKLVNTQTTLGPRGAIIIDFVTESSVTENEIYDPANGAGISFLDFNDLTIRGNTVRGSPSRAISSDDTTTANVAASWFGLMIDANVIQWNQANEAIYIVPASGKTIFNVIVTSNIGNQLPVANWIYYDRVTTGKVGNNTSRDGRAIAAGGTVTGVTTFNNN